MPGFSQPLHELFFVVVVVFVVVGCREWLRMLERGKAENERQKEKQKVDKGILCTAYYEAGVHLESNETICT